jgi:hypothetical protein
VINFFFKPKKYLLFAGHAYYPEGGASDYQMTGTILECKKWFFEHAEEIASFQGIDNWAQIAECETLKIIETGSHRLKEICDSNGRALCSTELADPIWELTK